MLLQFESKAIIITWACKRVEWFSYDPYDESSILLTFLKDLSHEKIPIELEPLIFLFSFFKIHIFEDCEKGLL